MNYFQINTSLSLSINCEKTNHYLKCIIDLKSEKINY